MTVETVSDVFAFILEQGDLTDTVLFSEQEIPELKPEERSAIESVSQHVKDSYVGLLFACREALLVAATNWQNRPTLEKNKSRPDTVWNNACIYMPLLIRKSWEARVTFGLWNTSETNRPIKLFADVTTQRRHFRALTDISQERDLVLRSADCAIRMGRILPKQGESFADIAANLARDVWPVVRGVYDRIVASSDNDA